MTSQSPNQVYFRILKNSVIQIDWWINCYVKSRSHARWDFNCLKHCDIFIFIANQFRTLECAKKFGRLTLTTNHLEWLLSGLRYFRTSGNPWLKTVSQVNNIRILSYQRDDSGNSFPSSANSFESYRCIPSISKTFT